MHFMLFGVSKHVGGVVQDPSQSAVNTAINLMDGNRHQARCFENLGRP